MAKKHAIKLKGMPPGCVDNGASLYLVFQTLIQFLTVIKVDENDRCVQFSRAIVIEPFWEVTPSMAFSITVLNLIVNPITILARGLNSAFKMLFAEIPITYVPVIVCVFLYIVTISCIFIFKYSVKIPWFIEFSPLVLDKIGVENYVATQSHSKSGLLRYHRKRRNKYIRA